MARLRKIKLPCSCEYDTLDSSTLYFVKFIEDMGIKNYFIKRIYRYNYHNPSSAPEWSYRCIAFEVI